MPTAWATHWSAFLLEISMTEHRAKNSKGSVDRTFNSQWVAILFEQQAAPWECVSPAQTSKALDYEFGRGGLR
jgi:hypothetical protein